jgi:hypothetical protein
MGENAASAALAKTRFATAWLIFELRENPGSYQAICTSLPAVRRVFPKLIAAQR